MMLASFLYALTSIIFKFVVKNNDFWLVFGYENIGLGMGAGILLLIPEYRHNFFSTAKKVKVDIWKLLTFSEGFSTGAQLSLSYAFLLAPVGMVSIVVGIGPLFIFIYGLILTLWFPK